MVSLIINAINSETFGISEADVIGNAIRSGRIHEVNVWLMAVIEAHRDSDIARMAAILKGILLSVHRNPK